MIEEEKFLLEEELKRVLEVLIPEMKCKLELAKDENDSFNAKISFMTLERGMKVRKMQKEHLIAVQKLKKELAEKESRLAQHATATKMETDLKMEIL